jgi:predicted NUDIX family phosphoesterase
MPRDSYLQLASKAIEQARRPLTPREMLAIAKEEGFLPGHLSGATMHKTMMARLAENIQRENNADFYRTGPGSFFLHSLASRPEIPDTFKHVYIGHRRSKSIRKENVLVAPRDALESEIYGDFVPYDENAFIDLYKSTLSFQDRAKAENNSLVKQFVTFTLVFRNNKILTYRRGNFTTTSDTLKGQLSVGFGGHVNDQDFTLFSQGGDAFRANAARELREELFLNDLYRNFEETISRTSLIGYVNVDGDDDAEHHIAVLVAFRYQSDVLPKKGELSINQLSWLDLSSRKNDLSQFDFWSAIILQNIYDGRLRIPEDYGQG